MKKVIKKCLSQSEDKDYFYIKWFKKNLILSAAAAAKSHQSCPTLCDPIDGSPQGSSVPEILQARTPEWVAISFSNAWKWKVKVKSLSHVPLLVTPWTAAYQAPPSMGFPRQEYCSGVPLHVANSSFGVFQNVSPWTFLTSDYNCLWVFFLSFFFFFKECKFLLIVFRCVRILISSLFSFSGDLSWSF